MHANNNPIFYIDVNGDAGVAHMVRMRRNQQLATSQADFIARERGFTQEDRNMLRASVITMATISGLGIFGDMIIRGLTPETPQPETPTDRTSNDPLRRDGRTGEPTPDPEARGTDHTQLGTQQGRRGEYRQAREFDSNDNPVRDIDFTDHGRPQQHPNPHEHRYVPNPTGGTPQRSRTANPLIF